jgi:hypothetical protein
MDGGFKNMVKIHLENSIRILFLVVLLFSLVGLPNTAVSAHATVFVSPGGSGTACTQASPCSLADGLGQVDLEGTLYARFGTYTGAGDQVVSLDQTINFYGGWDGSPAGPVFRNPGMYPSILDGENARRGITISGGASVAPVVDGWSIRNGNASGLITNCEVFVYTVAGCGGGIHVYQAEPEITHNIIHDNVAVDTSSNYGGGGGIYVLDSNGTLIGWNKIAFNNSNEEGPGWGGGIYIHESGGKTSILDNEIFNNEDTTHNSSDRSGAGIQVYSSTIQIHGNFIHDNNPNGNSNWSAGIGLQYVDNTCWIDENRILDNHGDNAITASYSTPVIQQNTIINPDAGTGVYIAGYYGVVAEKSLLYNNIIAGNGFYNLYITGFSGNVIAVEIKYNTLSHADYGIFIEGDANVSLDRSILSNHLIQGIYMVSDPENSITASNLLFYGNTSNFNPTVSVTNPLSGDPAYVDPVAGNFHIRWNSAARDAVSDTGTIVEDIDDEARPMGSGATPYDVGADEFWWHIFQPVIVTP